MKWLIGLLLSVAALAADPVEKLENSYVKKAEQIATQKQAALKEVAVKYDSVSKRLTESYLKSLKILLKKETQKGDFDSAIKIKAKIVEIESMLKGQAPPKVTRPTIIKPTVTKPRVVKVIKPVDNKAKLHPSWQSFKNNNFYTLHLLDDKTCRFAVNGNQSATGKWNVANGSINIKWDSGATNTYKIYDKKIIDNFGSTWMPLIEKAELISDKLNDRVYRWSTTMRILFQADGKVLKAGGKGTLQPVGTWKEISPGVIQWSMYKFHFSKDLSYYNIEKGGKKYDKKILFLGIHGGKYFNGHHYKFIKGPITWKAAYEKCDAAGAHLAVPTSKKELEFIYELAKGEHDGNYVWIGGKFVKSGIKWITDEISIEKFKHHSRVYGSYVALYGMELLGTTGTGKNSTRQKWLVGGYICEWEK